MKMRVVRLLAGFDGILATEEAGFDGIMATEEAGFDRLWRLKI
jgi:hypothetical protein